MTDPASSGAAGAAAFKAVGGASAVAAGGAGLAAVVVMLMTPPRSKREWAVGLISTVVASIGGGVATIEHFRFQHCSVSEARAGIREWMTFYNDRRYHQALGYRIPRAVFENPAAACGKVYNTVVPLRSAPALTTFPQAHRQEGGDPIFGKDRVSGPDVIPQRVGVAATGGSLA